MQIIIAGVIVGVIVLWFVLNSIFERGYPCDEREEE
jgi:hypothetical protein